MSNSDKFQLADCATGREILAQPDIWRGWADVLARDLPEHVDWIKALDINEIWLCGAGTSAFIGDLVAAGLGYFGGIPIRAIASTDLVASPRLFLRGGARPLVMSFGRSGNSAESIGTLDVLDALAPNAPRLNITCNADSILATRVSDTAPQRVINLPPATHDIGFAMTSSYSTMVLTALALLDENHRPDLGALADEAERLLPGLAQKAALRLVAGRVVFVGSGALMYAAREAALKVMELTAGQVPVLWDSALGFRHGPKSFVTPDTHVVSFISSDAHTARYETDLADELDKQFPGLNQTRTGVDEKSQIRINSNQPDHWNAVLYVLAAQVLSVHWSARLGLNVDDPFAGQGTLTRVVSGVKLYAPGES